jgi:hypothetical protein
MYCAVSNLLDKEVWTGCNIQIDQLAVGHRVYSVSIF